MPSAVLQSKSILHHPASQYPSTHQGTRTGLELMSQPPKTVLVAVKWTNEAMLVVFIISPNEIIDGIITTVY